MGCSNNADKDGCSLLGDEWKVVKTVQLMSTLQLKLILAYKKAFFFFRFTIALTFFFYFSIDSFFLFPSSSCCSSFSIFSKTNEIWKNHKNSKYRHIKESINCSESSAVWYTAKKDLRKFINIWKKNLFRNRKEEFFFPLTWKRKL